MRLRILSLAIALVLGAATQVHAQSQTESVTTVIPIQVESAKGEQLHAQVNALVNLIKAKSYADAERDAGQLRLRFAALFDKTLKQYAFQTKAEAEEFKASGSAPFEWIDWGYATCIQVQAFTASERKDYAAAMKFLNELEQIAVTSAGAAVETGWVLNKIGKSQEGLAAYRRAQTLSMRYASQAPYRAAALRGIGFTLINLGQLDDAEKALRDSLVIEPGNAVANNELNYISELRAKK